MVQRTLNIQQEKKMKANRIMVGVLALIVCTVLPGANACAASAQEEDERMEWWRDARFGMFIHWGLYAIPAGEWNGETGYAEWIRHKARIPMETYDQFVGQFNPVYFNADEWVRMAKNAGMKYIVITSKHHDGFCLWPSKLTDFDIEATPFKRDILRELSDACKKHGVKMCFYHSIMDWHHPNYPPREWEEDRLQNQVDMDEYTAYMKGQLKELIEGYDPGVLWFDGEWEACWTHERGKDLYDYVLSLKPDIIINNRVDKGRKGMEGLTKEGDFKGDFGTPEQEIPPTGLPDIDWESCITMNAHWGWNKNDRNWKSARDLIHKLIDISSKGGNFLLNVGPKPDGTFPDEAVDRLDAIGQWMQVNGEAIYQTTASPYESPAWGRYTRRPGILYAHIFDWPDNGKLEITAPDAEVEKIHLLADRNNSLTYTKIRDRLVIDLPADAPDPIASVIAVVHRMNDTEENADPARIENVH
jgi:alpha-L-fucosidase